MYARYYFLNITGSIVTAITYLAVDITNVILLFLLYFYYERKKRVQRKVDSQGTSSRV